MSLSSWRAAKRTGWQKSARSHSSVSRTLRMVADVFFYALKSVLYPLQPLYD
ncbi:EF_assoc_2 domain-containing protein, partial [Haematococcus lacustris]